MPTPGHNRTVPRIPTSSFSKSCCPEEEVDDSLWNLSSLDTQKVKMSITPKTSQKIMSSIWLPKLRVQDQNYKLSMAETDVNP
jgi:hypothetical protein